MIRSLLALLPFAAATAFAGITVKWEAPEKGYADVLDRTIRAEEGLERIQSILDPWLEKQGRQLLAEGTSLELTITEFDLAGRPVAASRGGLQGARTYKMADAPEIHLSWKLTPASGEALTGEARLRDAGYQTQLDARLSESLPHEKAMLRGWLREFAKEQGIAR